MAQHEHRHGDYSHHHHHVHGTDRHGAHREDVGHGHAHGVIDPSIAATEEGLRAVKWSFAALMGTALVQAVVVALSGSVALLADTIHNVADAATAVPLGIAFLLARRRATRRFTYGLGRVEDFAGLTIIGTIACSAAIALYQAVERLRHPQPVEMLWAVVLASLVGFAGNEAVALFRIRVGTRIGSAALVADGYHARVDGLTSLAVLLGALGVWLGYPVADPIAGLLISLAIVAIVWQSARAVVVRMLDGVDAAILDEITHGAALTPAVVEVTDVRARWIGHRLHAEVSIAVSALLSVAGGHDVAREVRHRLLHRLPHLGGVTIHVDPHGQSGERFHRLAPHAHDGLPMHAHD